jgi:phosphoribosylformylglycinamidine synthase
VYFQFVHAIKGMGEACKKFNTPVTGGNVSFYNQSPGGAVYPTPTIGMVGLLENAKDKMTLDFKHAGDVIYLMGESRSDIASSEYLHKICGVEYSPAPFFDLDIEFRLQQAVSFLVRNKTIRSAHDISEGGLFVALCESGFHRNLGFTANSGQSTIRADAFWFGESQSRVVVTVSSERQKSFEEYLKNKGIAFAMLGNVTEGEIIFEGQSWGSIEEWKEKYDTAIENYLAGETAETALSAV